MKTISLVHLYRYIHELCGQYELSLTHFVFIYTSALNKFRKPRTAYTSGPLIILPRELLIHIIASLKLSVPGACRMAHVPDCMLYIRNLCLRSCNRLPLVMHVMRGHQININAVNTRTPPCVNREFHFHANSR